MNAIRLLRPPSAPASLRVLFGLLSIAASSLPGAEPHPIATRETCELHPALDITLFAMEPDVVDPVALTFDEQGRAFVVEMRDYPYGFGPDRKPGGTVRMLEDTDGDGRADRSTLFAEGLSFPTSIAPWNGGVVVTAPPEVVFLKDTDGDGKADVREVLLKGFTLGVTDSNVNGLRWGLDNRLHGVNGGNGGNVVSTRKPGAPVPLRNLDFSFDPATGDFTPTFHTSGGFGLVFDEWGRSFVTYNINHLQLRIIPARYLNRFPGFPPVEAVTSISDHGEMSRIYPISEPETRVNHPEQSGHFSSAGGMGFVGMPGYPGDLPGSIFVCDVVGNLVHRDLLVPDGPIFTARRSPGEQTREFFGSRDPAFRPVGLELGPDGALYLIDMQRDVIEHPDYIPQKVKDKLDLRAGADRGRIYRLIPKGGLSHRKPDLRNTGVTDLVRHLGHSNQWWRVTAQRLLLERRPKEAVSLLQKLGRDRNPTARLHALWTLRGLGALDERPVMEAIADTSAGLRENGLLLAEGLLPGSEALRRAILKRAEDRDARVRFQAALTLGQIEFEEARSALTRICLTDLEFRWSRLAVLSSLAREQAPFVRTVLRSPEFQMAPVKTQCEALREMADLVGARTRDAGELTQLLSLLNEPRWKEPVMLAGLEALQSGVTRAGLSLGADKGVAYELSRPTSLPVFAAAWRLARALRLPESDAQREALTAARRRATDQSRPAAQRVEAIQLLALGDYSSVGGTLRTLLEGAEPSAVQQAAVEVLGQFKEEAVATHLVASWRSFAPAVRSPVINLLLQRIPFHAALLGAIESGQIKLGELNLDLEQRRRLLRESSPEIMARAAKLIGDEEYGNRKTIVEDWLRKLPANGDPKRGRVPFEKTCAQCHAMGGIGQQVGPDLAALAHRSVEDLLSNILDPNMAIHPNYVSYVAETASGEIETGILESESTESVVLIQALGKKVVLPRKQLKRFESSGLSLMPEGLEAGMTPADLRDLIAFLQERK
jgi:putative membrane-bound dehydrogenase-like protein